MNAATLDEILGYAKMNDEAASKAKADGQTRTARILKRTANEWRQIAAQMIVNR